MKASTVATVLCSSLSLVLGDLTINLGHTGTENVAWAAGSDPCANTYINRYGDNPCGIVFYINGASYALKNCGTSPYELIPGDGRSPLICKTKGSQKSCDNGEVYQVWACAE